MPRSFMAKLDEEFVYVAGHLGRDTETKVTQSGKEVIRSSIAVNKGQDVADWYGLVWWEDEKAKLLVKGQAIRLVGKLASREYNGKTYTDITVQFYQAYRPKDRELPPKQPVPVTKPNGPEEIPF
jgi:single-stranded DNA-binding protein